MKKKKNKKPKTSNSYITAILVSNELGRNYNFKLDL